MKDIIMKFFICMYFLCIMAWGVIGLDYTSLPIFWIIGLVVCIGTPIGLYYLEKWLIKKGI